MAGDPSWQLAVPIIEPRITTLGVQEWLFDPSFPLDIRFWLLNRERDIRLHRPSHLELTYVESGDVVYQLEKDSCRVRQGDLIVVNGHSYHRCRRTDTPKAQRAVVVKLLPELIHDGNLTEQNAKYLIPFQLQSSMSVSIIRRETGVTRRVFDSILEMYCRLSSPQKCSQSTIKTGIKLILMSLVDYYAEIVPAQSLKRAEETPQQLRQVFRLVETSYDRLLTVEDAASLVGLSRWHFMHFFKASTGEPFITYLNRRRISRAQALLISTDKPIAEIGLETGFCDQSYFGAMFRRFVNMTPQAYRRLGPGRIV